MTNAQFQVFVADGGYKRKSFWDAGGFERSRIELGEPWNLLNHPVVAITWYEAVAFCRWLTAQLAFPAWAVRLPTQPEWEKGARGGLVLPTVASPVAFDNLVVLPPSPLQPNPNPQRTFPWGDPADPERANCIESKIGTTSAVGCFAGGASLYGVEELSGNVCEWLQDAYGSAGKVLRGGAYYSEAYGVSATTVYWSYPDVRFDSYGGFRCVVVPLSRQSF